jgi:hypothetical protein
LTRSASAASCHRSSLNQRHHQPGLGLDVAGVLNLAALVDRQAAADEDDRPRSSPGPLRGGSRSRAATGPHRACSARSAVGRMSRTPRQSAPTGSGARRLGRADGGSEARGKEGKVP